MDQRGSGISRRTLLVATCALGMAATVSRTLAAEAVTIFSGTDEHWVPLQVAKAKGYFSDEGLDATVTVFTTGTTATEAFRAGRGDFISAGDLPSTAMWETGEAIGIAPMSSDTDIFGIVGKKGINSPKDLRGRKVATRVGSTGEFLLYRYLASGGVAPSEVNIIDLAPPDMVVALAHGDIDAFSWLAPFTTRAISSSKDIKLITSAKGFANNRIILSASRSFHGRHPELLPKVIRAVRRAIDFVRMNPEQATQMWANAVQGDPKQSLPVVKLIHYDMTFDNAFVSDMNALANFMIAKGALKRPIDWVKDMDVTALRQVDPKLVTATISH